MILKMFGKFFLSFFIFLDDLLSRDFDERYG